MSEKVSDQAVRIIQKLGGFSFVAKSTGRDITGLYRWTYSKEEQGGTGGVIPSSAMPQMFDLADMIGVTLTSEDLDPRCSIT